MSDDNLTYHWRWRLLNQFTRRQWVNKLSTNIFTPLDLCPQHITGSLQNFPIMHRPVLQWALDLQFLTALSQHSPMAMGACLRLWAAYNQNLGKIHFGLILKIIIWQVKIMHMTDWHDSPSVMSWLDDKNQNFNQELILQYCLWNVPQRPWRWLSWSQQAAHSRRTMYDVTQGPPPHHTTRG